MPEPIRLTDEAVEAYKKLFAAFEKLVMQVSPERSISLLAEMTPHVRAVFAGKPVSPSISLLAALVICQQHSAWGCPLYLTDELFDAWAASPDGCAECQSCGYRMPKGYTACVLCGAATGFPGVFKAGRERRAKVAGWN